MQTGYRSLSTDKGLALDTGILLTLASKIHTCTALTRHLKAPLSNSSSSSVWREINQKGSAHRAPVQFTTEVVALRHSQRQSHLYPKQVLIFLGERHRSG